MKATATDRSDRLSSAALPATTPLGLLSTTKAVSRCKRHGGCRRDCARDRTDAERLPWDPDGRYGGWGGHEHHGTYPGAERAPVIFVHGNQRDACDWEAHAAFFRERGFSGDELWAITFRDGSPTHAEMADQLEGFVSGVRTVTGADQVRIVAHSLGVTGARYWLEREDRYGSVDAFVGLAGANHGQSLSYWCQVVHADSGAGAPSGFLRADYDTFPDHPLADLNEGDETPGDVEYYTIRGTRDPLYWRDERSPELRGATENLVLSTDHDGVRASLESKERIYEWLTGRSPYDVQTFQQG